MIEDLIKDRRRKLEHYRRFVPSAYPSKVKQDFSLDSVLQNFSKLEKSKKILSLVGRLLAWRDQGGIIFADLQDGSGHFQLVFDQKITQKFDLLKEVFDVGDFLEVKGKLFKTKRGEPSLQVQKARLITKSLRPWPSRWFGLEDVEERYRKRYLDFLFHPQVKKNIIFRSRTIHELRSLLVAEGFFEVETPILQPLPGGAIARPFKTHLNALNQDVYLRIAPELYLKRLLVGGFEKIFEIGKVFRNEGIDREHYPEFTMLELYWAYQDYRGLMKAVRKWILALAGNLGVKLPKNWSVVEYTDLIKKYANCSIEQLKIDEIDEVFKKLARPNIIKPTFVIHHPKAISPLAKSCPDNPDLTERFQLIIAGTELVNGFSELNDPDEQRKRMEEQEKQYRAGNKEASRLDNEFLEALEYGMPPSAGLGLGIDRLVAFFTNSHSIREVITFPMLKPKRET